MSLATAVPKDCPQHSDVLDFVVSCQSQFILLRTDQARIAQLAEQLICNQQVGGSNPPAGSNFPENPVFQARSDS